MIAMRNPRRLVPFLLGLVIFLAFTLAPSLPDTVDPTGRVVPLTHEGKAALGLFLLAGIWWVFEVFPVGVTAIAIGVIQSLWMIRDTRVALTDFMDPSVWFIFGSLLIGAAFATTGLTRRLAFLMLTQIPEKTPIIYLGVFAMTASLDPVHGPYRRGGRRLPPAAGRPQPLRAHRQTHPLRQGAVHRHGLDRRRGQHHHPAGRGPRRGGHRVSSRN